MVASNSQCHFADPDQRGVGPAGLVAHARRESARLDWAKRQWLGAQGSFLICRETSWAEKTASQ